MVEHETVRRSVRQNDADDDENRLFSAGPPPRSQRTPTLRVSSDALVKPIPSQTNGGMSNLPNRAGLHRAVDYQGLAWHQDNVYRGTSLIKNSTSLAPPSS